MMSKVDYIDYFMSYDEFHTKYLEQNKPCHLSKLYTKQWKCRKEWIKDNMLDTSKLKLCFGDAIVPVVDCSKKYYSSNVKEDMKMSAFLDYWMNRGDKILYLKDWHCQREFNHVDIYNVPEFFQSDWLNEYWDVKEENDDYRFVYIGVKGSWTPFHADVFHSYSWSANICGLKKWLLYPPGEEVFLTDKYGKLAYSVTEKLDSTLYSSVDKGCDPIVVYQKEGEIIFVPSGWHHQVFNVEDTVSINHNWVNSNSIKYMWKYIHEQLVKVIKEIEDCKDMDGFPQQCQLILNASVGIDFSSFYDMLVKLIKTRLSILKQIEKLDKDSNIEQIRDYLSQAFITSVRNIHTTIPNISMELHLKYISNDLIKLQEVLQLLLQHNDSKVILSKVLHKAGFDLINDIESYLI